MLLDTKLPHVRLRGYYLVRPSDTPANGASMRLGSEYAADDGTGTSWRDGADLNDIVSAIELHAQAMAPDARAEWVVVAQFAFIDEGDGRVGNGGSQGWYDRETGLPARGALRVLYRRSWLDRLLGWTGDVRVQTSDDGGLTWREAGEWSATADYFRLPLPEKHPEARAGYLWSAPDGEPVPMAPSYTKRVETVSTQVAALWLLVLVDHGYMTRAGRPSDLLFVRTSKPAEVQS